MRKLCYIILVLFCNLFPYGFAASRQWVSIGGTSLPVPTWDEVSRVWQFFQGKYEATSNEVMVHVREPGKAFRAVVVDALNEEDFHKIMAKEFGERDVERITKLHCLSGESACKSVKIIHDITTVEQGDYLEVTLKPRLPESEEVLGIDLGTAFSVAGVIPFKGPAQFQLIRDGQYQAIPSVVSWNPTTMEREVGYAALNKAIENSQNTVTHIKRIIGLPFHHPTVQDVMSKVPYNIKNVNGKPYVVVGGRELSAVRVDAIILRRIKAAAEKHLVKRVRRVVVSVPANFDIAQRTETIRAAELAGLDVVRLVSEPVLAAYAYMWNRPEYNAIVLVIDFGGGTCDVTLMVKKGRQFKAIATEGDMYLGGEDFTRRLAERLRKKFKLMHGVDARDRKKVQELYQRAEAAKCELTHNTNVQIFVHDFGANADTGERINLDFILTREEFEYMTEDLMERFRLVLDRLMVEIEKKSLSKKDIDDILLVGGTSLIPRVQQVVKQYFVKTPIVGGNADVLQAVAKGAAIYGYHLGRRSKENLIKDVTPFTLGIPTVPEGYDPSNPQDTKGKPAKYLRIIKANTNIPVEVVIGAATTKHGQRSMNLNIYAGEEEYVRRNRLVQTFRLNDLPERRAGQTTAKLVFRLDESGVLNVTAMEETHDGLGKINTTAVVVGYLPHELNNKDLELNPMDKVADILSLVIKRIRFFILKVEEKIAERRHRCEVRDVVMKEVRLRCGIIREWLRKNILDYTADEIFGSIKRLVQIVTDIDTQERNGDCIHSDPVRPQSSPGFLTSLWRWLASLLGGIFDSSYDIHHGEL